MKSVFLLLAGIQGVYCLSTAREITGKKGASVTVPCQYSATYAFFKKYLCQGREFIFCSILKYNTHEQKVGDKVQIMDHEHESIFYITIKDLNEGDQAWYWCGIEIHGGIDQGFYFYLYVTNGNAGLSLTNNLLKGSEGQHLGIICDYDPSFITNNKRICRGRESYNCRNTEIGDKDHVEDKPLQRKFIVTLKDLKKADCGWYWIIMGSKDTERISFYLIVEDRLQVITPVPSVISSAVMRSKRILVLPFTLLIFSVGVLWFKMRRIKNQTVNSSSIDDDKITKSLKDLKSRAGETSQQTLTSPAGKTSQQITLDEPAYVTMPQKGSKSIPEKKTQQIYSNLKEEPVYVPMAAKTSKDLWDESEYVTMIFKKKHSEKRKKRASKNLQDDSEYVTMEYTKKCSEKRKTRHSKKCEGSGNAS
ncbi:uncharacterized protein LOC120529692 isoform X2 [Polypterus senegalus]|uniref:uncharacterized protein LOC120529692 isoform X2 n=1 Tax=Polypterus senegalus TaxID=55291 RepID=UPI001965A15F|nr:uncharacterized protein LOC120529692 isoform X2 [Polypterus senegalus]